MNNEETSVIAVQVFNLDRKLDSVHMSLKEDVDEVRENVREVREQTRLTNGRVSGLEKGAAMLKGALFVLSAATPFLLFALQELTH
ncbi:MAG TPA: hypothetical protein VGV69_05975 [Solirubrobacterales bacterium]|nr:hypothetical protein [Solirubrobacterales bacterium]